MLESPAPIAASATTPSSATAATPSKARPAHGTGDLKAWHDYVFLFDNPKGPHREYWQHVLGCRQWLVLERNTATNEVGAPPAREQAAR